MGILLYIESLQSVCIPEGVTTIPSSAFARCHNLTCVIMPGSLQTICGGAFSQCHKLTDVTIPDGVTVIETGAFLYIILIWLSLPVWPLFRRS